MSTGPTSPPLFRDAAVSASAMRYGVPVAPMGVGMWSLLCFVALILLSSVAFLGTAQFMRKETVTGELVSRAGAYRVVANKPGTISKLFVHEGSAVDAGDPILTITMDSILGDGSSLGERLSITTGQLLSNARERALANLEASKSKAVEFKLRLLSLREKNANLREAIEVQKTRAALLQKTLFDLGALRADKLISELQYRQAEGEVLNSRQSLLAVQQDLADNEYLEAQVRQEQRRFAAENKVSNAAAKSDYVALEEKELNMQASREVTLVAKIAGRITGLRAKEGEQVRPDSALAVVLPTNSELVAELWVPSSAMAFTRPGNEVRIMYDSFPYQKFGVFQGVTSEVAKAPTPPEELPHDLQAREGRYRIVVRLSSQSVLAYGEDLALTPGMKLSADLVQEKRSLLEWLLTPLIAARERQG